MKMESKTLSNSMTHWKVIFLLGYLASGLAHELAHLFAAKWLSFAVRSDDSLVYMFMSMLFGRSCQISSMETAEEWEISFVRHSGWIFSLVVAILFQLFGRRMDGRKNDMMDPIIQAATVTALEAISTDLLGCYSIGKTTFMCGNFGVIMLNDAWVRGDDNGKTVLDLLERMIAITMMRGGEYIRNKWFSLCDNNSTPLLGISFNTQLKLGVSSPGLTDQGKPQFLFVFGSSTVSAPICRSNYGLP